MPKEIMIYSLPEAKKCLVDLLNDEKFIVEDVSYQTASDGYYIRTNAIVTYSVKEDEKEVTGRVWTEELEDIFKHAYDFGRIATAIQDESSRSMWYGKSLETVKKAYLEVKGER